MATQVTDFEMFAGNSKLIEVTVRDDDGIAVPIDGALEIVWRLAASSWKSATPPTAILTKRLSHGITIANADGGIFTVEIDPVDTDELAGSFYHEASVTLADNSFETVLTGKAKIKKDLNRPGGSP